MKFLQFIFNFLFKKSDNQRKKDKPDFYSDDFQLIVNTPVSSETKLNKVQTPIQIKPDIIADKYYPVVIPSVKPNCLSFVSSLNERRIGVSEDVFFSYVFREFHELALNTIVVEKGGVKYEPDIAIIDEENGIYIDIEIDEPYSINGKGELIPTHAIGSDDKRNAFFKDNGWTIIRFSEKQVVMSPKKCLSIIRGVINDSLVFENDFKDKVWSENDSLIMIMNNYRDTYLPNPIFNLSTPSVQSLVQVCGA